MNYNTDNLHLLFFDCSTVELAGEYSKKNYILITENQRFTLSQNGFWKRDELSHMTMNSRSVLGAASICRNGA